MSLLALLQAAGIDGNGLGAPFSPEAVQNPNVGPMVPKDPSFTVPSIGQNVVDNARQGVRDWMNTSPQPSPMPSNVAPAFRTEDLVKGLLGTLIAGVIGGEKGADAFGSGYLGGKLDKAKSDTQQKREQWQIGEQHKMQEDQRQGNLAKFELQNAIQDMEMQNKLQDEQVRRSENELKLRRAEIDRAGLGYNNANSEGEKEFWAARLRNLDPQNAPTPEMVEADKKQLKAGRINNALMRWNTISGRWTNDLGELNESQVKQATAARDAIANEFQIEPESLPLPLTGKTIKEELANQKIAEMVQKGAESKDLTVQKIAKMKADIEYRNKKLDLDRQKAISQNNIAGYNAETQRINAENRKDGDAINRTAMNKVKDFQSKINGLKAKQSQEPSTSKRRAIQAQIESFAAQRDYWQGEVQGSSGAAFAPTVEEGITAKSGFSYTAKDGTKVSWKP